MALELGEHLFAIACTKGKAFARQESGHLGDHKRLRQELKGVDVEETARKIEAESNERARREYKILRD